MLKTKKIIAILSVIIIIISLFTITASAETKIVSFSDFCYQEGDILMYKNTVSSNNEIRYDNSTIRYSGNNLQFSFTPADNLAVGTNIYIMIPLYFRIDTLKGYAEFSYSVYNNSVNLEMNSNLSASLKVVGNDYVSGFDTSANVNNAGGYSRCSVYFPYQNIRDGLQYMEITLPFVVKNSVSSNTELKVEFTFQGLNFKNYTEDEALANTITQNQDENTDRIIENQNQLQQNEKDEAQSSGEGAIDDVGGAIEDKSSGFVTALGGLVNAMSYNGTNCAWDFPALYLPAIDGVMPRIELSEEKPIDFSYWVEQIPDNILLLIRSVLTIALIVFCFKELYSVISYVLTLKGGGSGE